MEIRIDTITTLEYAALFYHDAKFYADNVVYNRSARTFEMELERIDRNKEKMVINLIFFQIYSAPIVKSSLWFGQVRDIGIYFYNNIATNSDSVDFINSIKYNQVEKKIHINCIKDSYINIYVDQLDGKLSDVCESYSEAYYIKLFGLQIGRQ